MAATLASEEAPVELWNDAVSEQLLTNVEVRSDSSGSMPPLICPDEGAQAATEEPVAAASLAERLQMAEELAAQLGLNQDGRRAFLDGFLQSQGVTDVD